MWNAIFRRVGVLACISIAVAVISVFSTPARRQPGLALLWSVFKNTVGPFSGLVVPIVLVAAVVVWFLRMERNRRLGLSAMSQVKREFRKKASLLRSIEVMVWAAITTAVFTFFLVENIYDRHRMQATKFGDLQSQVGALQLEIKDNKHFLDVLQAFTVYRQRIGGIDKPCLIKVTSPKESARIATMVVQLAHLGSRCSKWGPMDPDLDPEVRRDTETGMVAGRVVFHARKGNIAAEELFGVLGGIVPLQRDYTIPDGSPEHFVWLQFGSNVRWNKEIE